MALLCTLFCWLYVWIEQIEWVKALKHEIHIYCSLSWVLNVSVEVKFIHSFWIDFSASGFYCWYFIYCKWFVHAAVLWKFCMQWRKYSYKYMYKWIHIHMMVNFMLLKSSWRHNLLWKLHFGLEEKIKISFLYLNT